MAAAAILLVWTIGAQGATVRMAPSSTNVPLGSSFDLDILAESVNLGGFDFIVGFNPALAVLTGVVPDVFLGDPFVLEAFFNSSPGLDTVQISSVSLLDSATLQALQGNATGNSFRLAKLTFVANAAGLAEFTFAQSFLTDADAKDVSATFFGASVTIGPAEVQVPEPATWSVVAGLALILVGRASIKRPRR